MICHCLCSYNHPQQLGICNGKASRTLRFSDFAEGSMLHELELTHMEVPMCDECCQMTLSHREKEVKGG